MFVDGYWLYPPQNDTSPGAHFAQICVTAIIAKAAAAAAAALSKENIERSLLSCGSIERGSSFASQWWTEYIL